MHDTCKQFGVFNLYNYVGARKFEVSIAGLTRIKVPYSVLINWRSLSPKTLPDYANVTRVSRKYKVNFLIRWYDFDFARFEFVKIFPRHQPTPFRSESSQALETNGRIRIEHDTYFAENF